MAIPHPDVILLLRDRQVILQLTSLFAQQIICRARKDIIINNFMSINSISLLWVEHFSDDCANTSVPKAFLYGFLSFMNFGAARL